MRWIDRQTVPSSLEFQIDREKEEKGTTSNIQTQDREKEEKLMTSNTREKMLIANQCFWMYVFLEIRYILRAHFLQYLVIKERNISYNKHHGKH